MSNGAPLISFVDKVVGGGTPPRNISTYWSGPIPWASVKDLTDSSMILADTEEHISATGLANSAANLIPAGIPIVCTRMAVGRCVVPSIKVAINQDLKAIFPNAETDARYLAHGLMHLKSSLSSVATGSTVKGISLHQLLLFGLYRPPLYEQRRIAEILDTADEAIRSTERLIGKLERAKRGLIHDLLTRGIDSDGRLRADLTQEPSLYHDTRLGTIPIDWTVRLLDEVSSRGSGHTPNKDIASYWNGGIRWVSLADSARLDKIYISETDKEISDLGIANSSAVIHRAGTVIISRDAGIGKSAILAQEMAVSQHFMTWTCSGTLDNHYLYYWLQFMKPRFEAIAMGSTIKTIGLPFFRRLSIPLPRIDQQKAAAAQLLAADADIVRHQVAVRKQRILKQGLADDMLTGRVRVGASA